MAVSHWYDLEHYYYDSKQQNLFSIITLPVQPSRIIILNKFNFMCDIKVADDIALRLEILANADHTIVEIPRLSAKDKKEIQFHFLSRQENKLNHEQCLLAVSEQPDEDGFVLDDLLNRQNTFYNIIPYWEELKLQLSLAFMGMLTNSVKRAYLSN